MHHAVDHPFLAVGTASFVQRLSEAVASGIQAKEEEWTYHTPELKQNIATVSIGLYGASVLMTTGDWRQAMAGTISLYNEEGKRQHTIYIAAAPECRTTIRMAQ